MAEGSSFSGSLGFLKTLHCCFVSVYTFVALNFCINMIFISWLSF